MAVPDFQSFFVPLLKMTKDGSEYQMIQARDHLARTFDLSTEDVMQLLPSGKQTIFANRVAWAKVYLVQAGLLESPKRGVFKITKRGLDVLSQNHEQINWKFLEQFKEFRDFRYHRKGVNLQKNSEGDDPKTETPEEVLEKAADQLRGEVAKQLLNQVLQNTPTFFEKLVVELLVKMGYGGSIKDAGQAVGRSGDEGIDGIIKEDKLGLDLIYLQAKRWNNPVSRPHIQQFVGALQGKRAKKGVFITTGPISKSAVEYVEKIDLRVVLIDGERLVDLMLDHNLGVTVTQSIEVKKIDSDYFIEE